MRVAVVTANPLFQQDTAAAARLAWLATALTDRGHEVAVFSKQDWGNEDAPRFEDGVRYHPVTDRLDAPDRRFFTRLPDCIRAFKPDAIHASHARPLVVAASAAAGVLTRSPTLADWYDVGDRSGLQGRLQRYAIHLPDRVVAPSRLTETKLHELAANVPAAVIPNPIDMASIREADPEAAADIVYANPLDDTANLESLLLALAELRMLDWSLLVIGDGPARERYEQQCADLRIADRVEFASSVPESQRVSIYKGAHVFAHTAQKTPFATELLCALACGCVGVVEYHAESSAHELIEGYERGLRVTSQDELVAALRNASGFEERAIDEAFAAYDESRVLAQYLSLYEDLGA